MCCRVYATVLGDPTRHRLLQLFAVGQGRTALVLTGIAGKLREAMLKHLIALKSGAIIVTTENPQDGRRLVHHLAPAIPATKTDRGWEMDFGYCLVRGEVILSPNGFR